MPKQPKSLQFSLSILLVSLTTSRLFAQDVAPNDAVKAVTVQALMAERADWEKRDTSATVPLVFTLGGIAVGGIGLAWAQSQSENLDKSKMTPGIVVTVLGGLTLCTGLVLFATRTREEEKQAHVREIDDRLKRFGVQLSFSPWVIPAAHASSGGVDFQLRF
jgi:hypothetical protein